ncbi:hypothetical protein GGR52DRAFT_551900 [Hypoxylon sp. FL1284]|nr:hypothetical protein GGR52DRAFT_551900 [Hypoxylon sp. FL1284]
MDSAVGPRGRGRKRHTLPITSPSHKSSEVTEQTSSETPVSMATRSFTLDIPSPSASRETRMRARQIDGVNASPEPISKGGRSLRKRPRVDYNFDNHEDADGYGAKATPPASHLLKKRKTHLLGEDTPEDVESRAKRRASEQPQSSSTRRRNYTRKSTVEPQTFVPEHQADDVEVQDTIEVGGHQSSESDDATLRRTTSGSSNYDSRAILKNRINNDNNSFDIRSSPQPMDYSQDSQLPAFGQSQPNQSKYLHDPQQDVEEDAAEGIEDYLTTRESLTHLDHLTPYIQGSHTYYPEFPEEEPEADADGNSEADSDATREADAEANPEAGPDTDATADPASKSDTMKEDSTQQDAASRDVPAEGSFATADDQTNGPIGDTPAETAANTPSAAAEPTNSQLATKEQFRFRKTRSASEFVDLFDDVKSLSPEELYYRTEVANRSLVAWQKEFNELRKLTDDYDNSVRYHKEEEAFERRFQMAVGKNPAANPTRKDFVVKGIRAEKNKDPNIAYARQQDRIMANVYGFEYDPREDKVGRQDPIAQRTGLGRNGRLRDRIKSTFKAAEAEDMAQGKRSRRMPERFNGGEPASRGSSPAPVQRRGRRIAQVQENNDANSNHHSATSSQVPEPAEPEPQKKKGRGGRPRKNAVQEPAKEAVIPAPASEPGSDAEPELPPEPVPKSQPKSQGRAQARSQAKSGARAPREVKAEPLPNSEAEPEQRSSPKRGAEQMEEPKQPARKRRRRAPATAPVIEEEDREAEIHNTTNAVEARKVAKPSPRRKNTRKTENVSGSFRATDSAVSGDQGEEARPATASSTATAATVGSTSNYQLREKRQRKFTNDINSDDIMEEPKPKRAKATPKKATRIKNITATSEPAPAHQPELETTPTQKASKIIKLKVRPSAPTSGGDSAVSSATSTPAHTTGSHTNGNTNGNSTLNGIFEHNSLADGAESQPKAYNSMTKSEKMSASMKARWVSGSMDGAVRKRQATLAAKKQNAKTPVPAAPASSEREQTRSRPSEDTESEDKEDVAV